MGGDAVKRQQRYEVKSTLAFIRRGCGLTQGQLGRELGLSTAMVSRHERGDGPLGRIFLLRALRVFDVSPDSEIGREILAEARERKHVQA